MAVPHDEESLRRNLLILLQKGNFDGCVGFLAFQSEPILDEVFLGLLAQGKFLAFPRFNPQSLEYDLVAVSNLTGQLAVGHYGIREPQPELPAVQKLSENVCWLVPGLAFSESGCRLGRGAGYYDRLFLRFPQGKRIGIAWEMQLLPEIPAEPWDIPMDYIVTESRRIDCHGTFT